MPDIVASYSISVEQIDNYEFRVVFDRPAYGELHLDEPPPLGGDSGPNAGRLLAAAIGDCLGASFLFAARKAGAGVSSLRAEVAVEVVRNENRRLRIGRLAVTLDPGISEEDMEKARKAREVFEDFCTITASVRQGIPVEVTVRGL
jgi:organic hydroperoxide reductase OsmC/OhrA